MDFQCKVCGYVYQPEQGDAVGGVPSGTDFEDLLNEWNCPVCGIAKTEFAPADVRRLNGNAGALSGLRTRLGWFK